jgi:hypothetical protein
MTIWRVILRDVRRSALLVLAAGGLDFAVLLAERAGWVHAEVAVWVARLLMFAIGAEVVFGDPISGPQAQWRTRPISGASMAVGKTLMLGGVAFGIGGAMFAVEMIFGKGMWPGATLALWEVFRAALWVLLGAALAVLVETQRGFIIQTACALIGAAVAVVAVLFLARHSELMASLIVRGARDHGRAVMLAGGLSVIFAFAAVARRYMWPHRIWAARGLAWLACLFVLGHEGLRLLVS